MKTYPNYKDSGVPWLGDVPEHWEIRRTKYILKESDRRSNDGTEQLLSVSQYTGVAPRKKNENSDIVNSRASSLVGYKVVQENNLVVNIMLAWNGSLGVSSYSGIVSPAYCIYRFSSEVFPKFFHYLFKTDKYKSTFKTYSTGVVESRLRLYSDKLGCIESLLPPIEDQRQIARYLDWQTAKINKFIKAKKKLIALLKEQKQNIINEAVTKGINPDVEMKDSGVEWLGEIPVHWEVRKFKQLGTFICGYSFDSTRFTEHGIRVLKIANIQTMEINWNDESYLPASYFELYKRFQIKTNDLVFALTRPVIKSGLKATMVSLPENEKVLLNQRNAIFRSNRLMDKNFLYYAVFSPRFVDAFLLKIDFTGQQPNISTNDIGQICMPTPPVSEQRTIASYIEKETALIDQTIARTEREIELIQEYRTRLVSDVVTGKVDVRSVEIPDFETVEDISEISDNGESLNEVIEEENEE